MKKRAIMTALAAASLTLTTAQLRAGEPETPPAASPAIPPQSTETTQHHNQQEPAPSTSQGACFKATSLMGREVQSEAGERLGKVRDFVIDLSSNTAPIAIVGYGGALGFGETRIAVPFPDLHWSGDSGVLALATTKDKFQSAPATPSGEWAAFASQEWAQNIDRFYGEPGPGALSRFERQRMVEGKTGAETVRDAAGPKGASELMNTKPPEQQNAAPDSAVAPNDVDALLAKRVTNLINQDAGPDAALSIQSKLTQRVVTLTGSVASQAQKQRLEQDLRALPGVRSVDDQLIVKE
jgi:sporulation protein YlmC with PRC-barrel domain